MYQLAGNVHKYQEYFGTSGLPQTSQEHAELTCSCENGCDSCFGALSLETSAIGV